MEDFYYCCEHLPEIDQVYVNEALTISYVAVPRPPEFVGSITSSFAQTSFFKKLRAELNCGPPMYKKTPSNTLYDWHVDGGSRKCSINIPLTSTEHAGAYFRTPTDVGAFYNLYKARYVLYKPTLLNVSHEHSVVNDASFDRCVLNISIHDFSYKATVEYFKNLTIDGY